MSFFPFFIDLENKTCVVAGGGMVAYRKAAALLEYGAAVHVAAPRILPGFFELRGKNEGRLRLSERKIREADMENAFAVIAAAGDPSVDEMIYNYCEPRGILVNVADDKKKCGFYFPAIIKRGELSVGITSGGSCPLLAKRLREEIEDAIPKYYGGLAERMGQLRETVKEKIPVADLRKECLEELLRRGIEGEGNIPEDAADEIIVRYQKRVV